MAPASTTPTPMGLLSTKCCPAAKPPFARIRSPAAPATMKPTDSSAASAEWPPTNVTPSSVSAATAPAIT